MQLHEKFKTLGSHHRLVLLTELSKGPKTQEALGEAIGKDVGNTGYHLSSLRLAGLVEYSQAGSNKKLWYLNETGVTVFVQELTMFFSGEQK